MKVNIEQKYMARRWFAWWPVLAEHKGEQGVEYYWVWLEIVHRVPVRLSGVTVFKYEV